MLAKFAIGCFFVFSVCTYHTLYRACTHTCTKQRNNQLSGLSSQNVSTETILAQVHSSAFICHFAFVAPLPSHPPCKGGVGGKLEPGCTDSSALGSLQLPPCPQYVFLTCILGDGNTLRHRICHCISQQQNKPHISCNLILGPPLQELNGTGGEPP